MKFLLAVTAFIEIGAGIALLAVPSLAATFLFGEPPESFAIPVLVRVAGSAMLTMGIACWLSRKDPESPAAKGLVAAMLFYNIAVVAVLGQAGISLGLRSVFLWAAVVVHSGMTVWCALAIKRPAR